MRLNPNPAPFRSSVAAAPRKDVDYFDSVRCTLEPEFNANAPDAQAILAMLAAA
jgi:hypothetical protein